LPDGLLANRIAFSVGVEIGAPVAAPPVAPAPTAGPQAAPEPAALVPSGPPPAEPAAPACREEVGDTPDTDRRHRAMQVMQEGPVAICEWTANGAVLNHDTHGDGGGNRIRYEQGRGASWTSRGNAARPSPATTTGSGATARMRRSP